MQLDPVRVADTRAWFEKADEDLRAAHRLIDLAPPLLAAGVFHCQQAAEKALKGLLVWHDQPFRKTHSLEEIGEQCVQVDPTLRPLTDRARRLTDYAWKFRYPDPSLTLSEGEAREALALAAEVCASVLGRLPDEVRP